MLKARVGSPTEAVKVALDKFVENPDEDIIMVEGDSSLGGLAMQAKGYLVLHRCGRGAWARGAVEDSIAELMVEIAKWREEMVAQ